MSMHNDLRDCYWFDALSDDWVARPALDETVQADVAIIGGGYTGLWTAYHLKQLDPALSVLILEAEHAGFGASGRNGGWLMGAIEGLDKYLASCDEELRVAAHREVHGIPATAGEVIRREGIDCDFAHGGAIYAAARYPEQLSMAHAQLDNLRAAGHGEQDYRWLEAAELEAQARISGARGAIFTPHVAAIQPAKLTTGLARVAERHGVRIYERSRVLESNQGQLRTASGTVKAPVIISAMEGYGSDLMSMRRHILPFQSGMVATEPLSASVWEEIGFSQRPVLADYSRLSTYMQRTADDRLVFGARGSYRFGGKPVSRFAADDPAFASRRALARQFFPVLENATFTHAWGGTLGISRRFAPHVAFDEVSGLGTAGGYTGEGVGASFLFGQTLAELILQRETVRTGLPWVYRGDPSRVLPRWEPEPLRWLGFKAAWSLYAWEEAVHATGQSWAWHKRLARRAAELADRVLS
jgi:glycine/D-amino acid oxidase-like deaminating enzyme